MLWFLRGLRRGIVTTRYPRVVDDWARQLPSPPLFRSDLLTDELADRLVATCPSGALTRDDGRLRVDLARCTGCGRCVDGVTVEPSRTFELATRDRSALVKHVPIRGGRGDR
jgi:dissimilatory sulfite reductase (desulfoviridin) alpha/beta subunit